MKPVVENKVADTRELARQILKEVEGLLLEPKPDIRSGIPHIG